MSAVSKARRYGRKLARKGRLAEGGRPAGRIVCVQRAMTEVSRGAPASPEQVRALRLGGLPWRCARRATKRYDAKLQLVVVAPDTRGLPRRFGLRELTEFWIRGGER